VGGREIENYSLAVAVRYGRGERMITLRARGTDRIVKLLRATAKALEQGMMLLPVAVRSGEEPTEEGGRLLPWVELDLAPRPGSER
jgi:hypothetical protein